MSRQFNGLPFEKLINMEGVRQALALIIQHGENVSRLQSRLEWLSQNSTDQEIKSTASWIFTQLATTRHQLETVYQGIAKASEETYELMKRLEKQNVSVITTLINSRQDDQPQVALDSSTVESWVLSFEDHAIQLQLNHKNGISETHLVNLTTNFFANRLDRINFSLPSHPSKNYVELQMDSLKEIKLPIKLFNLDSIGAREKSCLTVANQVFAQNFVEFVTRYGNSSHPAHMNLIGFCMAMIYSKEKMIVVSLVDEVSKDL